MTIAIAVSIINYQTAQLTIECALSVLAELDGVSGHIVIVDNASPDGSADLIEDWTKSLPDDAPVTLVRSDTNTGFSGGHNIGIQTVEADYYLILNSDAVLRSGFIAAILAATTANPKAGFIAPQIETDDGDIQVSQFRFHSPASELMRAAQSAPVTSLLRKHVVALETPAPNHEIEWASFACILVNSKLIRSVGEMDEGYFLYFEDAEYCFRSRKAGWQIVTAPEAVAVHFRGGSGPVKAYAKARKRLPAYYYSSRTRFMFQAYGRFGLLRANLYWHLGRVIAGMRLLVGKGVPAAVEHEGRDIWTNFTRPLGPRHAVGE